MTATYCNTSDMAPEQIETEHPNYEEEPETEHEYRAELCEEDELTDAELDCLKRDLTAEVSELEWEFKQAKEALYNERIAQVEEKLAEARSATAPEFLHVVSLVEESYGVRRQVARSRMEFALEGANKELDSALQVAQCKVNERLLTTEEQIRQRLHRKLCELQLQQRKLRPDNPNTNDVQSRNLRSSDVESRDSFGERDLYLPSPNLEPRKKPVSLSPNAPRLIYQLSEDEIKADLELIMTAVREREISEMLVEMNEGKRLS